MTLEELLECSPTQLESFTDRQLEEWFKPLFPLTRPELSTHRAVIKHREELQSAKKATMANDPRVMEAAREAKKYGIDLAGLLKGL